MQHFPSSLRAELRGFEIKDLADLQDWGGWKKAISTGCQDNWSVQTLWSEAPVNAEEFRASFLVIKGSLQS